ncbi:MAG: hypothetical protein ACYC6O_08440 [Thermoleophilia bacterium]
MRNRNFARYACAVLITAAALLAVSFVVGCDGEAGQPNSSADESKPIMQPDGALRGLVMAAGVTPKRTISDPRFAFTTGDREAFAVVTLGSAAGEGGTLTVAWYRLTGVEGRELLFKHEIPVGPGGLAYSHGIASGGLAPGAYETVATLGESQVRVPWLVRAPGSPGAPTASANISASSSFASSVTSPGAESIDKPLTASSAAPIKILASALAQAPAAEPEPWEVPGPGDYAYNWGEPERPSAPPQAPGPCTVNSVFAGFDPMADTNGSVNFGGTCSRMELAATVSGPPMTISQAGDIDPNRPSSILHGEAELCSLPGGSDLPGTVVTWSATGSEGALGSTSFTVPDYGELIQAIIQSDPEGSRRVEAGQTIQLRGMGMVMPPALGVKELSVYAGDELLQKVGNASGTSEPVPCDFGRWGAVNRTSYTVPTGAPPIIDVCAEAIGFDGHKSRACTQFYTGEVWEGTYQGKSAQPYCDPSVLLDGRFTLFVGDDGSGTLEGSGSHTIVCGGQSASAGSGFGMTAQRTGSGFHIEGGVPGAGIFPGGVDIPVQGNRGEGTASYSSGDLTVSVKFTLECKTCSSAG